MPSDIRSFFGGKSGAAAAMPSNSKKPEATETKKTRGKRKILEESDEDEDEASSKKTSPQKPPPKKKRSPTPEGEATTTSDYFGKSKPKKSAPVRASASSISKAAIETPKQSPAKAKPTPKSTRSQSSAQPTPNGRASTRRKAAVNYSENKADLKVLDDDIDEGGNDVFADDYKNSRKRGDDYEEVESDVSDEDIKPNSRSKKGHKKTGSSKNKKKDDEDDFVPGHDDEDDNDDNDAVDEDFEELENPNGSSKAAKGRSAKKRKSPEIHEDEEEADPTPKKSKAAKKSEPKPSPAKKGKKQDAPVQDSAEMKAIFDSIPLIRPPTPPVDTGEKKKFPFGGQHANSGPPPSQGAKDIPVGAENCLAGLTFVFTGLLDSISRDDGQNLVKRYGGKVVGAPSKKTSFVVLGADAGPKKLQTIADYNLKTINEDGLFELIRLLPPNGGDSNAAAAAEQKKEEEMKKVKKEAEEAEKEEKAKAAAAAAKSPKKQAKDSQSGKSSAPVTSGPDNRLWTVKYAPTQISQICGNKTQVERLQKWLRAFSSNRERNFKLAGADGMGQYRAVIIHGPPGIGKTTAAHLVAKMEGYDIVESNASDTRSKKLVESSLKGVLDTTSLLGYFAADGDKVEGSKKKLVLIMDEVDGMSAGDRGGVSALAKVCRTTDIPMILICNERKLPKMKPFDHVTFGMQFRRPTVEQIRTRIMTIGFREKMKIPVNVVNALIEGSGADIRQVINMVSTVKQDQEVTEQELDFDRGKQMSKAWEKHVILRPWDIVHKILGGGLFQQASNSTLNDKIELYFNDHEWSALMLQENYLGTNPIGANQYQGRERNLKQLELVEKAANSISEGDLVDRMIHGTQQHWSLMPTHAVFSFVRPASFVAGSMAGHQTSFTSWLGQNSTQGKLMRMIKEIQGHMRLRSSGDRHEIRQQYFSLLWSLLVKRLRDEGKDAVPEVIQLMDSYFLTKDDWDAIVELGVGPMKTDPDEKADPNKVEGATKAAFTRQYNVLSHPLPYMKASSVTAPKNVAKEKPDLEEARDDSDEAEVLDDDPKDENEGDDINGDISKDKYVKQPKKTKASTAGKGKGKAKKGAQNDEAEESEEDVKPTKGKGKAAKGKAKA